jgi:hypothetical protein
VLTFLPSSIDYAEQRTIRTAPASVVVAADYDGDGTTDLGAYDQAEGVWRVLLAATGFEQGFQLSLGGGTDAPSAGDYDGDGKADLAVLHGGEWKVLFSTGGYQTTITAATVASSSIPAR